MKIVIQQEDFDVSSALSALRSSHHDVGAVVSFVGAVREHNGRHMIKYMELEHYPGMTEKSLEAIAEQAITRWNVVDVLIIHRVGQLPVGAQIVLVAVTSQHRSSAFAACEFIMDYLKTQAPFWKKEVGDEGAQWVEAKEEDVDALNKWKVTI